MIIVIGWFFQNGLLKGQGFVLAGLRRTACGSHSRVCGYWHSTKSSWFHPLAKVQHRQALRLCFSSGPPKVLCADREVDVLATRTDLTIFSKPCIQHKTILSVFHLSAITTLPSCSCFSPTSDVLSQRMRHFLKAYQTTLVESLVWQLLQRRKWTKWAAH